MPEKPEGYSAAIDDVRALLPKDITPPDGFELLPDDHPEMVAGKQLAHDLGIPAADFPKLVPFRVQQQISENQQLEAAATKQRKLLGEKAPARIGAVETWLKGAVGEEHATALFPMLFTAKQVEAFEKVIARAGRSGAPPFNGSGRETTSKPDFSGLKGAERIHAVRQHAKGNK